MGELIGLSVLLIVAMVLAIPLLVIATPILIVVAILHWRSEKHGRISGCSSREEAKIIQDILQGVHGPKRNIVLMNAAPAFVACNKATSLKKAFEEAGRVLDSGAPFEKLEKLISYTNALAV